LLHACSVCQRQLDLGGLAVGEKIRCLCGETVIVPEVRKLEVPVHRCSSCGGAVQKGASSCNYCGATIGLAEKNLGLSCPHCVSRLHKGATYCHSCGARIAPVRAFLRDKEAPCPRCRGRLVVVGIPGGELTECASCGGIWLPEEAVDRLIEQKDASPVGKFVLGSSKSPVIPPDQVRYLRCPDCETLMHRRNFGGASGVIVDSCKGHGFWFDTNELEKILVYVRSGGLDNARQRQVEQHKAEERRRKEAAARSGHASSGPLGDSVGEWDLLRGLGHVAGFLGALFR
jgi:Zn-finger nucleic acid-binding protein